MKKFIKNISIILICFCVVLLYGCTPNIVHYSHSYTGEHIKEYFFSKDDYKLVETYFFDGSFFMNRKGKYFRDLQERWQRSLWDLWDICCYYLETETKAFFAAIPDPNMEIIKIGDEFTTEEDLIYIEECPYTGMLSDLKQKSKYILETYLSEEVSDIADIKLDYIMLKKIITSENKDIIDARQLKFKDYAFVFIENDIYVLLTPSHTLKMALVYPENIIWEDILEKYNFIVQEDCIHYLASSVEEASK